MQRFAVLIAAASVVFCSPDAEVAGSTNKCATSTPHTIQKRSISACASGAIAGLRPVARTSCIERRR
jgi:hypothetical protein